MKTKLVEQIEEVLKGTRTIEDIAEIEKLILEAKGKIMPEPAAGFWENKTPCWQMCRCPDIIKNECPAPKYPDMPCWAVEGTYCKLDDYGAKGDDVTICEVCRVYKKWGNGEPIQMRVKGKGINASLKAVTR